MKIKHRFLRKRIRSKKEIIASIRGSLLFFGYDVSNLSDEEIEKGTVKFAEYVSQTGMTAKECMDAFTNIIKCK